MRKGSRRLITREKHLQRGKKPIVSANQLNVTERQVEEGMK